MCVCVCVARRKRLSRVQGQWSIAFHSRSVQRPRPEGLFACVCALVEGGQERLGVPLQRTCVFSFSTEVRGEGSEELGEGRLGRGSVYVCVLTGREVRGGGGR